MLSIVAGTVGWSGYLLALPAAMAFPALWAYSPSRLVVGVVSAGYFFAASRGLPQGVANFYATDLWPGLLLWLAASASFVTVYAALWTKRPGIGRAARYLAAAALMAPFTGLRDLTCWPNAAPWAAARLVRRGLPRPIDCRRGT